MKKILVLLVSAILTMNAFANVDNTKNMERVKDILIEKNIDPSVVEDLVKSSDEQFQAFEVAYRQNQYYNLYAKSTPFVYEPKSGYLAIAKYNYQDGEAPFGEILLSSNMGADWNSMKISNDDDLVYGSNDKVPVFPSVAILNPDNSDNPEDFYMIYYGYVLNLTTEEWMGSVFTLISPEENYSFPYSGPASNNPAGGQSWNHVKLTPNPETISVSISNMLSNDGDAGYPYGKYGFASYNFPAGDFDASFIPPQWDIDNFTDEPSPTSSSNGPIYVDADEKGNLYAMVNNIFIEGERTVAFSKSTDNGATWTEFTKIPESTYHDFIYAQGGDPYSESVLQPWMYPYMANGFKVYGEDQFSAVIRLNINDGNNANPQFTEFSYDNGNWTLNKAADWSRYALNIISIYEDDAEVAHDFWTHNSRGNEVQLAVTEDNSHLILKWIEAMEMKGLGDSYEVYWYNRDNGTYQPENIDSMVTVDIFAAYKEIGSNDWSDPIRLSDDGSFNKMTWIPAIVPSINEVPMIKSRTLPGEGYENHHDLFVQRMLYGTGDVYFENFDLLNPNSVTDKVQDVTNSVVYPNPSAETVHIKYNLEQPANVSIILYDVNGNSIGVLQNRMMSAGEQETRFSASNLANGTYIYKLNIDGNIETGKFQISK